MHLENGSHSLALPSDAPAVSLFCLYYLGLSELSETFSMSGFVCFPLEQPQQKDHSEKHTFPSGTDGQQFMHLVFRRNSIQGSYACDLMCDIYDEVFMWFN